MNARQLIMESDRIADEKRLTQSEWSRRAGHAKNGQTISRIMSKGDCRLSTFIRMLDAIGCRLEIKQDETMKVEDMP